MATSPTPSLNDDAPTVRLLPRRRLSPFHRRNPSPQRNPCFRTTPWCRIRGLPQYRWMNPCCRGFPCCPVPWPAPNYFCSNRACSLRLPALSLQLFLGSCLLAPPPPLLPHHRRRVPHPLEPLQSRRCIAILHRQPMRMCDVVVCPWSFSLMKISERVLGDRSQVRD